MENNMDAICALLKEQKKHSKKALFHARLRTLLSLITAAVAVFAAVQLGGFAARLNTVDLAGLAQTVESLSQSAQTAITEAQQDLCDAAAAIASLDVEGLNTAIGGIASVDYAALSASMKKLEEIDFQLLGDSIRSLNGLITPLAQFFGIR